MFAWKIKETDNLQLVSTEEFQAIQKKYPGFLPIIIHAKDIKLNGSKYLTKGQIPFKKFVEIVKPNCVGVSPQDLLFFTANGIFIPSNQKIDEIYEAHKKSDGFLHINVCPEPQYPDPPVPSVETKTENKIGGEDKPNVEKAKEGEDKPNIEKAKEGEEKTKVETENKSEISQNGSGSGSGNELSDSDEGLP